MAFHYDDGGVNNYTCRDCRFNGKGVCKRIDRESVIPAAPYFVCDKESCGHICSDFVPKPFHVLECAAWTDFDDYWAGYVRDWLPYGNADTFVWLTLKGDEETEYGVSLIDWVFGHPVRGGLLYATKRRYQRRDIIDHGIQLYKVICEDITSPVSIPG